jgi:tetratricopeptide (TPR) repeat protein
MLLSLSAASYGSAGRFDDARARVKEALEILAVHENKPALCTVLVSAGRLALLERELGKARHYFERGIEVAKELSDGVRLNIALKGLAEVEFADGFIDRAIAMGRELVARMRPQAIRVSFGNAIFNLAQYLAVGGELAEARATATEALTIARDQGGFLVRLCMQLWALLAVRSGQTTEAAALLGFVDAGMQRHGETLEPAEQRVYDRLSALLTTALPPAKIETHAAEGALWSEAQALDFVLSRVIPR